MSQSKGRDIGPSHGKHIGFEGDFWGGGQKSEFLRFLGGWYFPEGGSA